MSTLTIEINPIAELALEVMQAVLAKNEQSEQFPNDENGPLALASALSDFFGISSALEQSEHLPETEQLTEFGEYGLDLLDRLSYFTRALEVMDQRDNIARIFATLGVWLAQRGATFKNLNGVADGFGWLVNDLSDANELAVICQQMQEVADAASGHHEEDENTGDPWRPWRVLNLNAGIAATRSLDPELMQHTFEKLGRRLPHDMPGFFADGVRKMETQNVPDPVREVMKRYAAKWPTIAFH